METQSKDKMARCYELLHGGRTIYITLDATRQGVVIPEAYRKRSCTIPLALSMDDLKINELAITGTLLFGSEPTKVRVPWSSVYQIYHPQHRGYFWHMPPFAMRWHRGGGERTPARRGHLRLCSAV